MPCCNFTGKERDSESGLDDFGARYYSSNSGRFISVDPSLISVRPEDPQSWNRYSYALNNPLAYTDPNGKWSTAVHNRIIDDVFESILSDHERSAIKVGSREVDTDQSMSGAPKHGMKAPWQSPEEAFNQGQKFISDNLNTAVADQLSWEADKNSGYSPDALIAFGEALHTVTDADSPWHGYDRSWYGFLSPTSAGHGLAEAISGPRQEGSIAMAKYEARLLWTRFQSMLEEARKKEKEPAKKKKDNEAQGDQ